MRRVLIYLIISLCLLFPCHLSAASEKNEVLTPQSAMEKQLDTLDLHDLEEFIIQVDQEVGRYIKDISLERMIENFKKGQLDLSPQEVLKSIFQYLFQEILGNLTLLGKLLIVAVVCVVLQNLQSAFANGTVAKLAYFVCYLVVITLAIGSFKVAVTTGLSTIDKMVDFMQVLLPVLLALLTAMGGLTSVALLQPFLMVSLSVMATFIQTIIFPMIFLCAVISIANNISDRFKVSRLAGLLKQFTKVGIGLVLTIFIGIVTVEGVAGAVVDGVSLRTAKFVTGAFVPVAGSMFADALDAVIGGSLLLKNAIGLTGVLVLSVIVLFPVLKILAVAVIYRLAAALLQPLGDSLMADALEDMAGSLFMVFAAVTSVAIMFFLTITIIVGAANFTVMLR
ncbi:MAG: stage sporulation protein [Peptococcaceae bacterium]|jgi:stage III sporulation protein AE|nr:stage sporulation protein [Peptococcaceae bacterium]